MARAARKKTAPVSAQIVMPMDTAPPVVVAAPPPPALPAAPPVPAAVSRPVPVVEDRYAPPPLAFGAWLSKQSTARGFVGQLAVIAAADRRFPRQGDPEAVRRYLREAMADGEMYDAVEDAEADWRALVDA